MLLYDFVVLVLSCALCSVLIVISVIDWRTFEIPIGTNIFILVLGIIRLALNILIFRFFKI